jgi:putative transposase
MSSHIHLIISSSRASVTRANNDLTLSDILRDFKKYTSKKVIEMLHRINESRRKWLVEAFEKAADKIKRNSKYKIWQDGNHPILLDNNNMMQQRLDYVHHNNPVEASIADEPEHYIFSSARDYAGEKGMLDVEFIE